MAAEANVAKKRKFIIIGGVIAVVAIIICIVINMQGAKMERIEGRYTNPETGDSIKIIYDDKQYMLTGKKDSLGRNKTYSCYVDDEGSFWESGDQVHMTFVYYLLDESVDCCYSYDGVEETFYFNVGKYPETYIKE